MRRWYAIAILCIVTVVLLQYWAILPAFVLLTLSIIKLFDKNVTSGTKVILATGGALSVLIIVGSLFLILFTIPVQETVVITRLK